HAQPDRDPHRRVPTRADPAGRPLLSPLRPRPPVGTFGPPRPACYHGLGPRGLAPVRATLHGGDRDARSGPRLRSAGEGGRGAYGRRPARVRALAVILVVALVGMGVLALSVPALSPR